jgi:hypothetical protein
MGETKSLTGEAESLSGGSWRGRKDCGPDEHKYVRGS